MKILTVIKLNIFLGLIVSVVLSTPLNSQAITIKDVPNPQSTENQWVADMADILSDETETELNRLITKVEQSSGTEIAVVTVPETAPADSPKTFATQLFNYWGIGQAESDNGILFLISTGDKRVEIETGYGIEGILSDTQVSNIIDTKITPQYKQGNYDRGTLDGMNALIGAIDPPAETVPISSPSKSRNILALLAGIGITSVAGVFLWWRTKQSKVFIDPRKAIIPLERKDFRDVYCGKCNQPMEKVGNIKLTKVQQVAKKIGSVSYRGYKCSSCSKPLQPYSLIAYYSSSSRYQECPECNEFTITRTGEILEQPTYTSKGKRIVRDSCHCCDYIQETTEIISRLHRYTQTNSGSASHSSNSRYWWGDDAGSTSGSSGGGFGGGSSDGGGAGGDW